MYLATSAIIQRDNSKRDVTVSAALIDGKVVLDITYDDDNSSVDMITFNVAEFKAIWWVIAAQLPNSIPR
jgi:ribonuclease PH